MSKKAQNIFFLCGFAILTIMVLQLDFHQVCHALHHAGFWFVNIMILWALLYAINAATWFVIIRSDRNENSPKISFLSVYQLSISGFALNYATPGGLMGGEPYRIMSTSPILGIEKASSSVMLYTITHMYSHFWFWSLSIIIFFISQPFSKESFVFTGMCSLFCAIGLIIFTQFYKKGIAKKLLTIGSHLPFFKHRILSFVELHTSQLNMIDSQITALYAQHYRLFLLTVTLELMCRFISAFEIYFVLLALMPHVSYIQCVLVLAFTSLLANLLFFIPLQLGGREGGFLISITTFGLSSSCAIFVALIVRLRELIWTAIGLILIKIGEHHCN